MKTYSFGRILMLLLVSLTVLAQNQTIENNQICMDPIVGYGTYVNTTNTGLCVGCPTSDAATVTNGTLSDYYQLATGVAVLLGGSSISVKDSLQYYPGGNVVGFAVSAQGGLLNAAALANIQIRTYRNGTLVETATSSGTLTATLLGGTGSGKQIVSFTTGAGAIFDEVQLFVSSALSLLSSIRVYYAFEGPASCLMECSVALTTGYTGTSSGSLLCPVAPANPGNLVDGDLTGNLTNIAIALGILCSKQVEVANNSIVVPAGTEAGFIIANNSGLIDLTLLGSLRIQTFNALGIEQDDSQDTPAIMGLTLLGSSNDSYRLGIKTTKSFSRIRLTVSGLASIGINLNVYYAYTETDSDSDGVPDCMDKCPGDDTLDLDGDGIPTTCDNDQTNVAITKATTAISPTNLNSSVTFTISLKNYSNINPTRIKVSDLLPAGLNYQSSIAPTGTQYDYTTGIWNVGSALQAMGMPNDSLVLSVTATAVSRGVLLNSANILFMFESNLNSSTSSSACISVPEQLCEGSNMTLHAPTGLGSYQWYKDGILISGATDSLYVASVAGSYTVNYSSGGACATGNCCPIIIETLTRPTANNSAVTACLGSSSTLSSSTNNAGDTYLWNTGQTTLSISITALVSGTYNLIKTSTNGCFNTDTVSLVVNRGPTFAGALTMCNNNGTQTNTSDDTYTITFTPFGGGGGTYAVSGSGFTTVSGLNYNTTSTAIGPFNISDGNRTVTLTDSINGCTLANVNILAPPSCSSCLPIICIPIVATKN